MYFGSTQSKKTVVLQDEGLRKLKGFVQIPKAVLMHKRISYGAKVAYGVLLGYAWQDDFCFPAQQALADDLACSVRQARRHLSELKDEQFISWEQKGLNQPNVYYILPIPTAAVPEKREAVVKNKDGTNMSAPDGTNMSGQERTNMSAKEYSRKNTQTTVNRSQNPLHNLPLIDQPKEKTEYIAERILEKLGDANSKKFYLLVATRVPEITIKRHVGEILEDGADHPAKLFTFRMQEFAKEQLAKSANANGLFSDVQNGRNALHDAMRVT